jgi:hypothetical protein
MRHQKQTESIKYKNKETENRKTGEKVNSRAEDNFKKI